MRMKRQHIYLLYLFLLPALFPVSGCSDPEHSGPEQVLVELRARGNGEVDTKAGITQAFGTTLFASMRNNGYTGLTSATDTKEWKKDTEVQTDGRILLPDKPTYPENGDWLYLVAVAPAAGSSYNTAEGSVTYTLTGQTDLMYASQISGNRWDGSRFTNTDGSGTPLTYKHLLTQLTFKAKKVTDGLTVKVQKITVSAPNSVTLTLADGTTSFSNSNGSSELSLTFQGGGTDISSTDETTLSGTLLLPPLADGSEAYKLTVETSVGIFRDLPVTAQSPSEAAPLFTEGTSHEITLNISDKELGISSVTVSGWNPVVQDGGLNLIK